MLEESPPPVPPKKKKKKKKKKYSIKTNEKNMRVMTSEGRVIV